jgi:ribosomal protein L11 methyltransferase
MKYFEIKFKTEPSSEVISDILSAFAAEAGCESFVTEDDGLTAYVQQSLFQEEILKSLLEGFPVPDVKIDYSITEAEDKDWNEEWEKNYFQPIIIDDQCVIHSTFHKNVPKAKYDIIINPQMAFGTGHHETTSLMLGELLQADLKGKIVLDMGCGTSILAIMASKRGAKAVTAIDIDDWCISNSKDNFKLNNITNINVFQGDANSLIGMDFDVVIANINRNILLQDMHRYVACMQPGSCIYMSGFYVQDIPQIRAEGERLGLTFQHFKEKNNWCVVKLIK